MTLKHYVFERSPGVFNGATVATHLAAWVALAHRLGKFPTTAEFAEHYGKSERQAWRYRARIHQVFADEEFRELVMVAAARLRNGQDPLDVELPEVKAQ